MAASELLQREPAILCNGLEFVRILDVDLVQNAGDQIADPRPDRDHDSLLGAIAGVPRAG
jgi:hypothetical protein